MANKIGEILIERGVLTPGLVDLGLDAQKFYGGRVGSLLVDLGAMDERDLIEALCAQLGAKAAKAGMLKSLNKATLDAIPVKIATRYQVVPLSRDNRRLTVAITDPNDLLALDELAFVTGCVIEPLLASERTVLSALEAYYGVKREEPDKAQFDALKISVARAKGASGPPGTFSAAAKEAASEDGVEEAEAAPSDGPGSFWSDEDANPLVEATPPGAAEAAPSAEQATAGEEPPASAEASPVLAPAAVADPPSLDDPAVTKPSVADGNALLVDGDATEQLAESPRTVEEAGRQLARVEIRDEIADVILWCTEDLFPRSALFIFQKSRAIGWTGQGQGLRPSMVRKVVCPKDQVSLFTLVWDQPQHYLGEMPDNEINRGIVEQMGGDWPSAVLCVPFGIKGRALGCFYAEDTLEELQSIDLNVLFKLVQKAGLALELLLLRTKIAMP